MLQNVFDILLKVGRGIPALDDYEPRMEPDIPLDIYRAVRRANSLVESSTSIHGRLLEAYTHLKISQVFEAEIERRKSLHSVLLGSRDVVADIKFDMTCVTYNRTRHDLANMRTTNIEAYTTKFSKASQMRLYGLRVATYTNNMGSSASLLIFPHMIIQAVTHSPIIRANHGFLEGISNFIKGSHEFQAIQNLVDHLSTWFEGWMAGSISSEVAMKRLEAFLGISSEGRTLFKDSTSTQRGHNTLETPENDVRRLIEIFSEIPRTENATYSTVGTAGYEMSLNITDMESLGSQRQLTERAIEAVLATTKFPEGVMFARASGYGSLYDQQEYEHQRSMSIQQDVKTILCPIHTGESTQHWIGVVVRLDFEKRGKPSISMTLLDSMATHTDSTIYDKEVIKNIVQTWLRHRLPDFRKYNFNAGLPQPRDEQQVDPNSCGVHMLLNLRAAGLDGKYISRGSNCTSKEWIDNARESFAKRILRSAGKHLGGDVESTINELLNEPGRESL